MRLAARQRPGSKAQPAPASLRRRGLGGGWCRYCRQQQQKREAGRFSHIATCVTGWGLIPIPQRLRRHRPRGKMKGMTEMSAVVERHFFFFRWRWKKRKEKKNTSALWWHFSLKWLLPTRRATLDDDKHTVRQHDWKAAKSNYDCENVQSRRLRSHKHRKSYSARWPPVAPRDLAGVAVAPQCP